MVASEDLEKARAYSNHIPGTNGLMSPPKDIKISLPLRLSVP